MLSVCFALTLLASSAHSWFSCDEVEFCSRIRNNPTDDIFTLDLDNANINEESVQATLTNTKSNKNFNFTLTALEGDIFRVFIDDPENGRHRVSDALDGDPTKVKINTNDGSDGFVVTNGDAKAVLQSSPFRIQFYRGDELISVVNNEGRLVFEEEEPEVAVALDVYFPGAQRAYGLPSHADSLALRTTGRDVGTEPYRFYNIDHPGYELFSTQALYGTIPVLYGHSTTRTSGVFWLNSAQTFVDINNQDEGVQSLFLSESGVIDLFILTGPTLQNSVRQYAKLTGVAPVPQYFALGYHQSRYNYMSVEDVETVVNEFDNHDFPLDVIWLDIDYTDSKKYFTWDPETFADPIGMQEFLNSTGRHLVVIIDPHYYKQEGYFVYDECESKGYFVKNSQGESFVGDCWPGASSWIDYFNPDARDYYSSLFAFDKFVGSTEILHVWNDMNEPSVFGGYETSMPKENVHYGGWLHRDVHNQYGFYQHMGTYKGLVDRMDGKQRPFVLTRSFFAGSQRYTAMWTGDNLARFDNLPISFPMCLSVALGGLSLCGADVGGFNENVGEELLQRWTQAAVWLPFFRQHSEKSTNRREPYLYDDDIQDRLRYAMQIRYFHLPYWYTTFYEHYRTGDPVIRPVTFHYASDENVLDMDNEWLVGENILVHPATEQNQDQIQFYLPGGENALWYDVENTLMYRGTGEYTRDIDLSSNIYFYRGGSIVPRRDTIRKSSVYTHHDPIKLYIFLDSNGSATGTLYIDDGTSFDYTRKVYNYIQITYSDGQLSISNIDEDASYDGGVQFDSAVIYRPPSSVQVTEAKLRRKGQSDVNLTIAYGPDEKFFEIGGFNVDIKEPFTIHLL